MKTNIGPDGFLVLMRCTMDDLPVAFFHDNPSAIVFAKEVCKNPEKFSDPVQEIFGLYATEFLNATVIRFIGGQPTDYVRYFELETAE